MLKLRKTIILAINIIPIVWLGYIIFFEAGESDFAGLFFLITVGSILFFNTCAVIVYILFKGIEKRHWLIEILFVLALLFPALLLCWL